LCSQQALSARTHAKKVDKKIDKKKVSDAMRAGLFNFRGMVLRHSHMQMR
jgi:hypothetical protein